MTRKQSRQPNQPSLPIAKLDNVPGPEADTGTLNEHYRRLQEVWATHAYDDVIQACRWCCDMEAPLAYTKPDEARGDRMYCSGRCASAAGAYRIKVLGAAVKPAKASSRPTNGKTPVEPTNVDDNGDKGDDPAGDAADAERHLSDTAESEQQREWLEARSKPRTQRRVRDVTEVKGNEGTGKTTAGPKRTQKEPRADGMCSKGKHEMTPENTYSYNGGTWCRECRKASRAKSNGGSK